MMFIAQLAAKVLLSGAFVFFAGALTWQAWRIWFNRSLVLTAFDYLEEGKPAVESGEQFARMVRVDLVQLAGLYNAGAVANTAAVPDTGGGEPAAPMEMPAERESMFDSIELKAYGIELGSIVKTLRRQLESPSEITGSVTKQGDAYAVFAELRRSGHGADSLQRWNIQYAKDVPEATRNVACRIFRSLAGDPKRPRLDAALFRAVDDEDFCLFNRALAAYDQYRVRKVVAPDDAAKLLASADAALANLRNRDVVTFPYVHKLAALVLYEQAKYADAETESDRYLEWAAKAGRNDAAALGLANKIKAKKLQKTPATSRLRPLQPGSSIGSLDSKGAGMICCIVKDAAGRRYLLSAQQALGQAAGEKIVQPAVADGGTEQDVVAELVKGTPTAAIARINEDVLIDPKVLSLGAIAGIEPNPAVGEVVVAYGFDGKRREGTVISTGTPLSVVINPDTGDTVTVEDTIVTADIAPDGAIGAPVLTVDDARIIGMVYGVGGGTTLVVPIESILDELDVELVR